MKNIIIFVFVVLSGCYLASCDSFIDVVPDDMPTLDHAFSDRHQAEKFLFTLYSYMPLWGHPSVEGRFDDLTWLGRTAVIADRPYSLFALRDGNRASTPYCNSWEGTNGGMPLFQAIRDCNIFLERIDEPRDLNPFEKIRWIAEAKFLKAYFHFLLIQQYGPIPIVDVNLPFTAPDEDLRVSRASVDEAFDYVIRLIDEAIPDLPLAIEERSFECGRVTLCAALAVKAKIAVTAASPLFNGNEAYSSFKDRQGKLLISDVYEHEKWAKAVDACKQAIDSCHRAGHALYRYVVYNDDMITVSDETVKIIQVSKILNERWNEEHVWSMAWPSARVARVWLLEEYTGAMLHINHAAFRSIINPTMKAAELFYSNHGVPIEEDKFYDYGNRFETVLTTRDDIKYVQSGVLTAKLHLNREYRFYGSIAFDGGWWFGLGRYDENNQWPVNSKSGGTSGQRGLERFSCTSFFIKKLINPESSFSGSAYQPIRTDHSIIRLADLYLLYAEALNEYLSEPNAEVWDYVNRVRERAGLETVQDAWTNYAKTPDKYTTQLGMREIIRRERSIELMFEGQRYFDLKRWDIAPMEMSGAVKGWNYRESAAEDFYQVVTYDNMLFNDRDALAPIRTGELIKNSNLVQNPGW